MRVWWGGGEGCTSDIVCPSDHRASCSMHCVGFPHEVTCSLSANPWQVGDFLTGCNDVNIGRITVDAAVKTIVSSGVPRVLRFVRLRSRAAAGTGVQAAHTAYSVVRVVHMLCCLVRGSRSCCIGPAFDTVVLCCAALGLVGVHETPCGSQAG